MNNTKNLLIVKADALGDYILFRNFIKILKENKEFRIYNIYLLCNNHCAEIANFLDKEFLEEIIPLNKNKYIKDPWYQFSLIEKLNSLNFDILLHPTYTRNIFIDNFIHKINAHAKITFEGDLSDMSWDEKKVTDTYYTKLIPSKKLYDFELNRYKDFFETLLSQKIPISNPIIETQNFIIPPFNNYIILAIGAFEKKRRWSYKNFAKIAKYVNSKYIVNIVICGNEDELKDAKLLERELLNQNVINLCGSTSTVDLLSLVNFSLFIIANDSGIAHISASLKKPCFIISNGNHYKRFIPYKDNLTVQQYCLFPFDEKLNTDYLLKTYHGESNININEIEVTQFINKFDLLISKICQKIKTPLKQFTQEREFHVPNKKLDFSKSYNIFFEQIQTLAKEDYKYIVYGYGTVGKTLEKFLPIQCFIDKSALHIQRKNVISPTELANIVYDKIIISVLGREEQIITYLINNLNIKKNDIIILKVAND